MQWVGSWSCKYVMTLMAKAVWIMLRTISEPWQDVVTCLWNSGSFGNVSFRNCAFSAMWIFVQKGQVYVPSLHWQILSGWLGEVFRGILPAPLTVWNSSDDKPLHVLWKQQLTNRNAEYMFGGNMECLGPGYLSLTQEIPGVLYTLESKCIVVVVNTELVLGP